MWPGTIGPMHSLDAHSLRTLEWLVQTYAGWIRQSALFLAVSHHLLTHGQMQVMFGDKSVHFQSWSRLQKVLAGD